MRRRILLSRSSNSNILYVKDRNGCATYMKIEHSSDQCPEVQTDESKKGSSERNRFKRKFKESFEGEKNTRRGGELYYLFLLV